MSDLLNELQEAHRESPSWRLFGLCHQAATRIAALEAQLAEAKERNDKLHRRCQIAEGLHQSVVGTLEMWSQVCSRKDFDTLLFWYALQDMMKAKKSAEQRLSALEATPPAPKVTEEFKQYRRKQVAELRPWSPGECMDGVSVSGEDAKAGSPKLGDMIARNPKNHDDKWLVAAAYFADNFEPLPALTAAQEAAPKVTEAMVEAASHEYMRIFGKHLLSEHAQAILTAAQEAGKP